MGKIRIRTLNQFEADLALEEGAKDLIKARSKL